jgi:hypothetical protein
MCEGRNSMCNVIFVRPNVFQMCNDGAKSFREVRGAFGMMEKSDNEYVRLA